MRLRSFLILSLLAVTFSQRLDAKPPNIVLIISDDQAWTDYSFMGHEHVKTPHIDKLASQSLTFTRGYVPDSLCRPSLMTIITGLYPHQAQGRRQRPAAGARQKEKPQRPGVPQTSP